MAEKRLSVILVDDDEDVRRVLRLAFEVDGRFDVIGVGGGAHDAIWLASAHRPDGIVLDIRMPGMDGLSALPAIRREAPYAKVLVFSVLDEELMGPQLEAAGADDYQVKGTAPIKIVQRLAELCGHASQPQDR